jgi:hypothetical protein
VDLLSDPVAALGLSREERRRIKPVYHLAIAAAKDPDTGAPVDRTLSDADWADIAQEYMHQIGLDRRDDLRGVRWVAVRHAEDHVHVVATLARQDGSRPRGQRPLPIAGGKPVRRAQVRAGPHGRQRPHRRAGHHPG